MKHIKSKDQLNKRHLMSLLEPGTKPSLCRLNPFLILKALSSDDLNFRQLSQIISKYPSIAARLIFLANSAWAAPRVPIEDLESACARLGTQSR